MSCMARSVHVCNGCGCHCCMPPCTTCTAQCCSGALSCYFGLTWMRLHQACGMTWNHGRQSTSSHHFLLRTSAQVHNAATCSQPSACYHMLQHHRVYQPWHRCNMNVSPALPPGRSVNGSSRRSFATAIASCSPRCGSSAAPTTTTPALDASHASLACRAVRSPGSWWAVSEKLNGCASGSDNTAVCALQNPDRYSS